MAEPRTHKELTDTWNLLDEGTETPMMLKLVAHVLIDIREDLTALLENLHELVLETRAERTGVMVTLAAAPEDERNDA